MSNDQNDLIVSKTNDQTKIKNENMNKKRKINNGAKEKRKVKKTKSNFIRKNIKKIFSENDLNESTLKALKEEQERKQRLQENQASLNLNLSSILNDFNKNENCASLNEDDGDDENESDEDDDDEEDESFDSDDADDDVVDDEDLICLDESFKQKSVNENVLILNDAKKSPTYNEISDDSDDCQIISDDESELLSKNGLTGLHMNDQVNLPDSNGRVLVNLNHPSTDPDIYLNQSIASYIKPHQIGGIRFMYDNIVEDLNKVKIKDKGFGCILAHSMGLGKTLQVISFTEVFLRCTGSKCVLCIVPINTIQNWLSEFNSWLPENGVIYKRPFKIYILNDSCKTFDQRTNNILQWRNTGGVLLMGYELFRTFISLKACRQPKANKNQFVDLEEEDRKSIVQREVYNALLEPCLVICDEGHRVKNSSANIAKTLKSITTKRRIVLTGYPLQNNLIEYWCMVDFVRPSYLGTKAEFSNMFERPITNGQCVDSTNEDMRLMRHRSHVLHTLLEGFVQRRGHDVLYTSLPRKEEYIILLQLSPIQKELYLAFMEAIGAMNLGEKPNPLRTFAICCKIWNHPDVLYDYIKNKESEMDLDLPDMQPLVKRQTTSFNSIVEDNDSMISEGFSPFSNQSKTFYDDWALRFMDSYVPDIIENGTKFDIAFTIIEESVRVGDKILLFSQSLLTLNLIEKFLAKYNVPNTNEKWEKNKNFYRLDGSTSGIERESLINSFNIQGNGVWLFLLSTRAGCLGINLVGANRVIVLDASFNPCHDAQAVCRVYRYGQKKQSYIYRLITDHTMEKRIYDRQINKQSMSDRVVDEIQAENHLTRTEVEKLIHYVKEDVPSADLSNLTNHFNDEILINSCLKHQQIITKEPFRHESLLLDKKEYQLSNREKRMALQEYELVKNYSYNYGRNSYLSYYKNLQSNSYASQLSNVSSNSTNFSSSIYDYRNSSQLQKSPNSNDIYKMYKNYDQCSNLTKSNTFTNSLTNSFQYSQNQARYSNQIGACSNLNESSSSTDIEIIDASPKKNLNTNVLVNNNNHTDDRSNNSLLKEISIRRIVTTTAIPIPSSNTSTNSGPTMIPAGENVILLNTPKGVYLRLPDGKFFAIRNQKSERTSNESVSRFDYTSNVNSSNINVTSTTSVNTQPICSTINQSNNSNLSYLNNHLNSNTNFIQNNSHNFLNEQNCIQNNYTNIVDSNVERQETASLFSGFDDDDQFNFNFENNNNNQFQNPSFI